MGVFRRKWCAFNVPLHSESVLSIYVFWLTLFVYNIFVSTNEDIKRPYSSNEIDFLMLVCLFNGKKMQPSN